VTLRLLTATVVVALATVLMFNRFGGSPSDHKAPLTSDSAVLQNRTAAQANLSAAIPALQAYFADNGTYAGLTVSTLQALAPGVKDVVIQSATATSYCIESTIGTETWNNAGPGSSVVQGHCP
jgi:hypothetical protein